MAAMIGALRRKSSYGGGNGGDCLEAATWRKATYCAGSGAGCIEAGITEAGQVLVRDTTNRDGGTLTFTPAAWRTFATHLKHA